jgi:peptidyl-dipeptidase A
MWEELRTFVGEHTAQVQPLTQDAALAAWRAQTTGKAEHQETAARLEAELMRVHADAEAYRRVKGWYQRATPELATADPLLARQLKLLYLSYLQGQRDEATIDALTRLEKEVQAQYVNFRGVTPAGRRLSDNDVLEILAHSDDSEERRAAWEASQQIGDQVADKVLELVHLRNAAARKLGFADFWKLRVFTQEMDEAELLALFERLAELTDAPFRQAKQELDAHLARRFGLPAADLRPWHYADPFFQRAPATAEVDMDRFFADAGPAGRGLERLAIETYDGVGLDVRDILARSDLYEREGKNQHAFCTDIDRQGDVRVLCNLKASRRWAETLLHELGHAVYDKYLDINLPWLLRTPAHSSSTEGVAMLFGRLPFSGDWLTRYLGMSQADVAAVLPAVRRQERLGQLIFVRWATVMLHFERALYADPSQDLHALWWDLKERYQRLARPEGRDAPDWAAKIHVALWPVYYHNYVLGELTASQLQATLVARYGGLVGQPQAGRFLREQVFAPGAAADWSERVHLATGHALDPVHFVRQFVAAG